jgi:hypothetical protein
LIICIPAPSTISVRGALPEDPGKGTTYQAGELVGLVVGDAQAVGIVLMKPARPDEPAPPWVDRGMHLIGLADAAGGEHEGPMQFEPETVLSTVQHEVAPELRASLTSMFEAYRC